MRFYLGTHRPNWLGQIDVPLFVSHSTLGGRRGLPKASAPWALDSGGFTQISKFGQWTFSERTYIQAVRRYRDEIRQLAFASPMDWMCEPWITEKTGLSVEEHQRRTVDNYLSLRWQAPDLPFVPVLQGWVRDDYLRCVEMYERAGIDLDKEPLVGLGSVCRREATREAEAIVLALRPLKLHGYGMKITGLRRYGYLLESSDSMAWSYAGRMRGECTNGCANHMHYAMKWRQKVLASMDYQQLHLGAAG